MTTKSIITTTTTSRDVVVVVVVVVLVVVVVVVSVVWKATFTSGTLLYLLAHFALVVVEVLSRVVVITGRHVVTDAAVREHVLDGLDQRLARVVAQRQRHAHHVRRSPLHDVRTPSSSSPFIKDARSASVHVIFCRCFFIGFCMAALVGQTAERIFTKLSHVVDIRHHLWTY